MRVLSPEAVIGAAIEVLSMDKVTAFDIGRSISPYGAQRNEAFDRK